MIKMKLMGWADGKAFFITKIDFKNGKVYGEDKEGEFEYEEEEVDIYMAKKEGD